MSQGKIVFIETPVTLKQRYGEMASAAHLVPPLGLMSLAAVCREAGYKTEIIDATALGLTTEQVVVEIQKMRPRYIGLTAATVSFYNTIRLAHLLKTNRPELIIIMGGVHVTALPIETLQENPDIDYVVVGEGEETLLHLLAVLEQKKELTAVAGIAYRNGQEIRVINQRDPKREK
ncbi:B12-binding domain-containing radical SAM protein, partial [candidate division CSSED10-310 bacterium]